MKAYAILCNQFQIENAIIIGTSADQSGNMQNHMWNAVKPEDGNWYAVDVTWDDQKTKHITSTSLQVRRRMDFI